MKTAMEGNGGNSGIRAVILDYGEVLCHRPSRAELDQLRNVFGADEDLFRALWDKNRGAFDRGDMTAEAYWSALAKDAGVEVDRAQLDQACWWDIEMWGKANEEMVAWLRRLRGAGIKTALLSNIHPRMIAYVRENFDWLELFDWKTFSAEVHMIKPEREIYEHTLRGLGARAAETLFVDDREINVRAARDLGMHALQFRSVEQLGKDLEAIGFPILPVIHDQGKKIG